MKSSIVIIAAALLAPSPAMASDVFRFQLPSPLIFTTAPSTTPPNETPGGGDSEGGGPPGMGGNAELPVIASPEFPVLVELGEAYAGTLSSDGGVAPYAFTTDDILPEGITLEGDYLFGSFDATGVQSFVVQVADAAGETGSRQFLVDVMEPLLIDYAADDIRTRVGVTASVDAPDVSGAREGYEVLVASGSLPDAAMPASDGSISITPSASGTGSAAIHAIDGLGRTSPAETISWTVLPPVTISGFAPTTALDIGSTYASSTPIANHAEGALTWSVSGALPDGLSVDASSGVISGAVGISAANATVRYVVTDSLGATQSAPFSFTVQNAIVASIDSDQTNVVASTFFSPEEWSADVPKRLVIDEDVVLGATSTSSYALSTGLGMGGTLTIENHGSIQGKGGNPGAVGGSAINAQVDVRIENHGAILAGGGGGGKGGTGGQGGEIDNYGSYTAFMYSGVLNKEYFCRTGSGGKYRWNGGGFTPNTVYNGYWYDCDTNVYFDGGSYKTYKVRRRVVTTSYQSGTTGGNGGMGMGYGTVTRAGIAATPAINGAGTGGTGGVGGNWGEAGANGSNGGNGSYSNGSMGSNGAAPGSAIVGASRVTLTNLGTLSGALIN